MNLTDPAVREAGARALYVHTSYSTARTLAERERWWDERVEPEDKTGWLTCWDRIVAELAPVLAQQADAGPERERPEPKPCEGFAWVGQAFTHCDDCGQPYWEHTHEWGYGEDAGKLQEIPPKRAANVRRKWQPGWQADAAGEA